ncbi:hypothetical protein PSTG_18415, partial [Puccinia striiformis f. sp. tritici PST-78]
VSVIFGKGRTLDSGEYLRPVVLKNVLFSYPARPNTPILNGLDLGITPGSSLAIAGSSGSGKSTLAYLYVSSKIPLDEKDDTPAEGFFFLNKGSYDSTIHNQEGSTMETNELMSSHRNHGDRI